MIFYDSYLFENNLMYDFLLTCERKVALTFKINFC